MSIIRHPIWQYAYFVEDIDEACRKWNKMMGAGPFHVVRHHVAENFQYRGQHIEAVQITVTDIALCRPVEIGVHALVELRRQARAAGVPLFGSLGMFHAISGTKRLHQMIERGANGGEIAAAWNAEVGRFRSQRQRYLLY